MFSIGANLIWFCPRWEVTFTKSRLDCARLVLVCVRWLGTLIIGAGTFVITGSDILFVEFVRRSGWGIFTFLTSPDATSASAKLEVGACGCWLDIILMNFDSIQIK